MTPPLTPPLADLYEADETAWLEAMAALAAGRRAADLDLNHLAEYLADMAKRDKREVESRLAVLIAHLLKWEYQPDRRSRSWQLTVEQQRQELRRLLTSGTLRNHADAALAAVYADAVRQAMIETGLPAAQFPAECPYPLPQLVDDDLPADGE
jgi:hypothetical protein